MNDLEHHTIIRLERELAELRAELAGLRAELATEVRTGRVIVVDDGARQVEISPGHISVEGGNGCHVSLTAMDWYADVNAVVGDTVPLRSDRHRWATMRAAYEGYEVGHDAPQAAVEVNGVEVAVRQLSENTSA